MTDNEEAYRKKIKQLESALTDAQLQKAQMATGKVDMVEHQAMRQELEALRRTVKDLQHALEEANEQTRMVEDQLEDKNDIIERINQDLDGLRARLSNSEERRHQSDEAKMQAETRLSLLQERVEANGARGPVAGKVQSVAPLAIGLGVGALLVFVLLQFISFSAGKGELISYVFSKARPVQATKPTETASQGEQPKQEALPELSSERRDGGSLVEDPTVGYALVTMKGGSFMMGNRTGAKAEESPEHQVNLPPFLIGQTEVTFDLYDRFAQATGRPLPDDNGWGRGEMPAINVSWEDAQALAEWLSKRTNLRYRLPTEAEWEYVASAGRDSPYWWGYTARDGEDNCFDCGSAFDNRSPAPVGSFKASPYNLKSTAGNVQEWVEDCYRKNYEGAPTDGGAARDPGCTERVVRGGAYNKSSDSMKYSRRGHLPQTTKLSSVGLRLARDP